MPSVDEKSFNAALGLVGEELLKQSLQQQVRGSDQAIVVSCNLQGSKMSELFSVTTYNFS
jgi:enamine deaminase RidA (YjgF/YER057c/UK114 family)